MSFRARAFSLGFLLVIPMVPSAAETEFERALRLRLEQFVGQSKAPVAQPALPVVEVSSNASPPVVVPASGIAAERDVQGQAQVGAGYSERRVQEELQRLQARCRGEVARRASDEPGPNRMAPLGYRTIAEVLRRAPTATLLSAEQVLAAKPYSLESEANVPILRAARAVISGQLSRSQRIPPDFGVLLDATQYNGDLSGKPIFAYIVSEAGATPLLGGTSYTPVAMFVKDVFNSRNELTVAGNYCTVPGRPVPIAAKDDPSLYTREFRVALVDPSDSQAMPRIASMAELDRDFIAPLTSKNTTFQRRKELWAALGTKLGTLPLEEQAVTAGNFLFRLRVEFQNLSRESVSDVMLSEFAVAVPVSRRIEYVWLTRDGSESNISTLRTDSGDFGKFVQSTVFLPAKAAAAGGPAQKARQMTSTCKDSCYREVVSMIRFAEGAAKKK